MVTVKQLRAARERIVRGWTQGVLARNAKGGWVEPYDEDAVCWCAVGALLADGDVELQGDDRQVDGIYIIVWNDTPGRTQADVIAFYDRRIAAAEAAP